MNEYRVALVRVCDVSLGDVIRAGDTPLPCWDQWDAVDRIESGSCGGADHLYLYGTNSSRVARLSPYALVHLQLTTEGTP